MTKHVFNTTGMKGAELAEAEEKALTQEQVIMEWWKPGFSRIGHFGPSQVQARCLPNAPLTSVRRAMTNLTNQGKLEKTDYKVKGMYGRKEFTWRLAK